MNAVKKENSWKLIVILAVLAIFAGCAGQAFKEAKQSGTVAAYDAFLRKHPKHELAKDARELREKALFNAVTKENTVKSCASYLKEYPEGKFVSQVKAKKESLVWEEAEMENSVSSFDAYLKEYPDGKFALRAKEKKESLLWEKAEKENSVSAFDAYLKEYPEGKFAAQAEEKKESLIWEKAEKENTLMGFKNYLGQYPNGKFASEAKERTEPLFVKLERFSEKITKNPSLCSPDNDELRDESRRLVAKLKNTSGISNSELRELVKTTVPDIYKGILTGYLGKNSKILSKPVNIDVLRVPFCLQNKLLDFVTEKAAYNLDFINVISGIMQLKRVVFEMIVNNRNISKASHDNDRLGIWQTVKETPEWISASDYKLLSKRAENETNEDVKILAREALHEVKLAIDKAAEKK